MIKKVIKFKAKIWKQATSYVITIPKVFLKANSLEEGQEYLFEVKEAQNSVSSNSQGNKGVSGSPVKPQDNLAVKETSNPNCSGCQEQGETPNKASGN